MKKLAIGCVVLLLLGIAGAAGASYFAFHRATSAFTAFAKLGTLPEIEQSVRNRTPYTPPASGELSRAQLEGLLSVQHAVRARLGVRADEMERRYRRLLAKEQATAVDAPEIIGAYRDLAAAFVEAKRAQVEALNRAGLSLEEYRWTRSRAYAALGMRLMELDVAGIIADVKAGREPATPVRLMTMDTGASPRVRHLVEPYRMVLEANLGLAFFGL